MARLSQTEFAAYLGLTRNQWAGIEYGWTPLKYSLAKEIFRALGTNPFWAATGKGNRIGYVDLPSPNELKIQPNALFSDVFFGLLLPLFENECPDPESEMALRFQRGHANAEWIKELFAQYVPDGHVKDFGDELAKLWHEFSKKFPQDEQKRVLQRRIWYRQMAAKINSNPPHGTQIGGFFDLTHLPTSDKTHPVNHWHRLKSKIQKATEIPGGRSMLAKFLGVDLTQISRWLSKNGPEPGADYTLKMLHWVQERESQQ